MVLVSIIFAAKISATLKAESYKLQCIPFEAQLLHGKNRDITDSVPDSGSLYNHVFYLCQMLKTVHNLKKMKEERGKER